MSNLVSQEEYDQLKELQLAGATVEWTRRQTKRSWHTINRLFKSKSYADYTKKYPTQQTPVHTELEAMVEKAESSAIQEILQAKANMNAHFDVVLSALRAK